MFYMKYCEYEDHKRLYLDFFINGISLVESEKFLKIIIFGLFF